MKTNEKIEIAKTKQLNVHAGHRDRLRKKILNSGAKSFEDHEILELILTYVIPRKNTNTLAHDLLKTFGSFSRVLNASIEELTQVNGVGKQAALFINLISNTIDRYNNSIRMAKKEYIRKPSEVVEYFRKHFSIKNYEEMFVFSTNKNGEVIKINRIEGCDESTIEFTTRDFAQKICSPATFKVAIVHTHPDGSCNPSAHDLIATEYLL